MAKFKISASPAKANSYGGFSVIFDLTGKPDPIAPKIIEVSSTQAAMAALEDFKTEAAALGQPLAVSLRLVDGRSPSGFKAANAKFYHPVNV